MLSRQSLGVNKEIKQLQKEAGVSRYQVWTLVPSSQTRWIAEYEQVVRNNLLRHAVDQSVENFKRKNRGSVEAIVEPNISDQGSKADRVVPVDEMSEEEWVVCERETSLSIIKITQSLIY